MRTRGPAQLAFAIGIAGLGALCLVHGDFAEQWQSVPRWFPWPRALAYVYGAVLLASSVGLLVERAASRSALTLTALQSLWVLVRAGDLVSNLASMGHWYAFGEALAPVVGSWILWGLVAKADEPLKSFRTESALRGARMLFGASCVVFGLAHFAFADFTASMIPPWLPARVPLAYLTGAFHVAAGLAIVISILARLAATLEAIMLGCFVLLVHIPSIFVSPPPAWASTPQIQWTELLLAWVLAASAGLVAASLRRLDRNKTSSV